MPREKGQLPKAYLRIDPNIDQHPDMPLLVRLLCAANRQAPRGRFKTWAHVVTALGRGAAKVAKDHRHIIQDGDGWEVQDWNHWQEGDLSVGLRMKALRERKRQRSAVTPAVTVAVTGTVTDGSQNRIAPSEASGVRRQERTEGRPAPQANPLITGRRPELQSELLRLCAEVADLEGGQPDEVYASTLPHQRARGMLQPSPANLSDNELLIALTKLRDRAAARRPAKVVDLHAERGF